MFLYLCCFVFTIMNDSSTGSDVENVVVDTNNNALLTSTQSLLVFVGIVLFLLSVLACGVVHYGRNRSAVAADVMPTRQGEEAETYNRPHHMRKNHSSGGEVVTINPRAVISPYHHKHLHFVVSPPSPPPLLLSATATPVSSSPRHCSFAVVGYDLEQQQRPLSDLTSL